MAPSTCVHCARALATARHTYTYPRSGYRACLACVSQPSADETDDLLAAYTAAGLLHRPS